MTKLIVRIIAGINILVGIPLLLAYLAPKVSPASHWIFAFLGLAYPVLVAIQLFFLLVWILFSKRYVLLPILLIAMGWQPLLNTFQFRIKSTMAPTDSAIRCMSYNVRLFDYFNWSGIEGSSDSILSLIRSEKPQILCLQEFISTEKGRFTHEQMKKELGHLPYHYVENSFTSYRRQHGVAIFSAYPIIHQGSEHFTETTNMFSFADLKIGTDTIRVYNAHLESIHFESEQYKWLDTNQEAPDPLPTDQFREIIRRMKQAYIKRARQAAILKAHIQNSPHPVIVCGDFNDTPVSYTVQSVRKGLTDSFRSKGSGMGATFHHFPIPLRIDYIFHDSDFLTSNYRSVNADYSDHRPLVVDVVIKKLTIDN